MCGAKPSPSPMALVRNICPQKTRKCYVLMAGSDSEVATARVYDSAEPYYAEVGHYINVESRKQRKTVMWRSLLRPKNRLRMHMHIPI